MVIGRWWLGIAALLVGWMVVEEDVVEEDVVEGLHKCVLEMPEECQSALGDGSAAKDFAYLGVDKNA